MIFWWYFSGVMGMATFRQAFSVFDKYSLFGKVAIAIVCSSMATVSAVQAENIDAVTGSELEAILNGAGLGVSMTEDATSGAPVANAQLGGISFWVRGLDCSGTPSACGTLMFFANFELGRSASPSDYKIVNSFNDGQVFGRAYVLEDASQVGVDYVVELDGGVSAEHVSQNISRWADVIAAFIEKFSSGSAGA